MQHLSIQEITSQIERDAVLPSILDEMREVMSTRIAMETDEQIMARVRRRLGVQDIEPAQLLGRCTILKTVGSQVQTFILDGRPLLRLYPIEMNTDGTLMRFERVIEDLEP